MFYRVLIFFSLIFCCFCVRSQTLQWVGRVGGQSNDNGNRSVVDKNGNLYISGSFQGNNVDFDPGVGAFVLSSNGLNDAFVAKYDINGKFKWAFKIGGSSQDEVGDIALDSAGNFTITGFFRGAGVDFDPSSANFLLNSNGESGGDPGYGGDIFVAKYDTSGVFKWAFNVGAGDIGDNGLGIYADKNNDLVLTGYFRSQVDFDPSTNTSILDQTTGTLFIAKYSSSGQFQWAFNTGQGGIVDNTGFDIVTDNANNVIVTGFFQGTNIDFNPSSTVNALSSNGLFDVFIAKYSPTGQYLWAKSAGGTGTDVGRAATVDASGNIYVTGDYSSSTINFNAGNSANTLVNKGGSDLFLVKYSPAGVHLWSFGTGGPTNEFGWSINCDLSGKNILISGAFNGTNVDFDPSPNVINLSSKGSNDVYAVKYSEDGRYLCSFSAGGTGNDMGKSISSFNNFSYLTGIFSGSNVDFDPSSVSNVLSAQAEDAFLAKYDWSLLPPSGLLAGQSDCVTGLTQLTFNATSGVGPFILTIHNGTTTTTYPNIVSGIPFSIPTPTTITTYTLTGIKDASPCSALTPANSSVVMSSTSLPIMTSGDVTICKSDSTQLSASGGISYQWSPASGLDNPLIATPKASPAVTTVYKVVVTNTTGCKDSSTLTVAISPSQVITISPTTASFCPGDSVQLAATGGVSYQWFPSFGLSNPSIPNPKASPANTTTYRLIVTNSDGCIDSLSKLVTRASVPSASVSPSGEICRGDSLQLLASGGLTYRWFPTTGLADPFIPNPKASPGVATTYQVFVINQEGCSDTAETTISLKPSPSIGHHPVLSICKGDTAQLEGTGGVTYQWKPIIGLTDPTAGNPLASPQTTTTYTVIAAGSNGCVDSANTLLIVNQPPLITVPPSVSVCVDDSVQLSVSGGLHYEWSPTVGLNDSNIPFPLASPATNTIYKVVGYSNENCKDSGFVSVLVKPKPSATISQPATLCFGDTTQLTAAGGSSFSWFPNIGLSNNQIANPFVFVSSSQVYTVVVSNDVGCKDSLQTEVNVVPKPISNLGRDTSICTGESLSLNGAISTGVLYMWNTGETTPTITINTPGTYVVRSLALGCTNPSVDSIIVEGIAKPTIYIGRDTSICSFYTLQINAAGNYVQQYQWSTGSQDSFILVNRAGIYSVSVSNKCGEATDVINIGVDVCSDDIFFPTAFTPNYDRLNDVFKADYLQGVLVFDYELMIFNRWGEIIFKSNDATKGWNGKVNGKDQPSGVFVWIAKYRKSIGGKLITKKGTVTLIR